MFVTVSRQRLDYGRALLQPGANSNSPPIWTPARIAGLGAFRAGAHLATTPCETTAAMRAFRQPVRPSIDAGDLTAAGSMEGADEPLGGLLDAIAAEVHKRTAVICAGIAADFAQQIRGARQTLPRDQVAAVVAALRQAKKAAVRFARKSAALEIAGLQKQARALVRKGRMEVIVARSKLATDSGPSG